MDCDALGCNRKARVTLAYEEPKQYSSYCMICGVYNFKNEERAIALKKDE